MAEVAGSLSVGTLRRVVGKCDGDARKDMGSLTDAGAYNAVVQHGDGTALGAIKAMLYSIKAVLAAAINPTPFGKSISESRAQRRVAGWRHTCNVLRKLIGRVQRQDTATETISYSNGVRIRYTATKSTEGTITVKFVEVNADDKQKSKSADEVLLTIACEQIAGANSVLVAAARGPVDYGSSRSGTPTEMCPVVVNPGISGDRVEEQNYTPEDIAQMDLDGAMEANYCCRPGDQGIRRKLNSLLMGCEKNAPLHPEAQTTLGSTSLQTTKDQLRGFYAKCRTMLDDSTYQCVIETSDSSEFFLLAGILFGNVCDSVRQQFVSCKTITDCLMRLNELMTPANSYVTPAAADENYIAEPIDAESSYVARTMTDAETENSYVAESIQSHVSRNSLRSIDVEQLGVSRELMQLKTTATLLYRACRFVTAESFVSQALKTAAA